MCIIVDTDKISALLSGLDGANGDPIRKWLGIAGTGDDFRVERANADRRGSKTARGRLVYTIGGKFEEEICERVNAKHRLEALLDAGRARYISWSRVESEQKRLLDEGGFKSNDSHVLALAIVSGARVLYTGDKKLMSDFKNKEIVDGDKGKVYQCSSHYRLLDKAVCP